MSIEEWKERLNRGKQQYVMISECSKATTFNDLE